MARIRSIKPDLTLDEELAKLKFGARYFFINLWCHCDREGRCEDRPQKLKALILPWDDINAELLIAELTPKFLLRYEVEGKRYIQVRTFLKHQRPHIKEGPSEIPAPPKHLLKQLLAPPQHLPSTVFAPTQHITSPLDNGGGSGNGGGKGGGDGENNRKALQKLMEPKGTPSAVDLSQVRITLGKYRRVYVTSLPLDEVKVLLRTPRLGQKYKAALEWWLKEKTSTLSKAARAAAGV